MSYASLAEFKLVFAGDTARVAAWVRTTDAGERDTILQTALDAASATMDSHFVQARYPAPLDYLASGQFAELNRSDWALKCMDLAIENLRPGVTAVPEGMVAAKNKTLEWLESLHRPVGHDGMGRAMYVASIAGLTRSAAATFGNTLSTRIVEQAAHGFTANKFIGLDGATWELSQDDGAAPFAMAMVMRVFDADSFELVFLTGLQVYRQAHGLGAAGDVLYLSQVTAGAAVTTPTGQRLGRAIDDNTLLLDQEEL